MIFKPLFYSIYYIYRPEHLSTNRCRFASKINIIFYNTKTLVSKEKKKLENRINARKKWTK